MDELSFTADVWNQPASAPAAPVVDALTVRVTAETLGIDRRNAEAVVVHAERSGHPLPRPARDERGNWETRFHNACARAFNAWAASAV